VFLKEKEYRFMIVIACAINCFGALMKAMFCSGHYLGMSPFLFSMTTFTVADYLYRLCVYLPLQVMFAKLIPHKIESSLFAFATGLMYLSNFYIPPKLGSLIDSAWFHTNIGSLSEVWKLYIVQACMTPIPILFIWLLPKRAEVAKVQACLDYLRLQECKAPPTEISTLIHEYTKLDQAAVNALKITDPRIRADSEDSSVALNREH
jgi:BT1 family